MKPSLMDRIPILRPRKKQRTILPKPLSNNDNSLVVVPKTDSACSLLIAPSAAATGTLSDANGVISSSNISSKTNDSLSKTKVSVLLLNSVSSAENTSDGKSIEKSLNNKLKKPIKCVLCCNYFQTLSDMQHHYLSTHKSKKKVLKQGGSDKSEKTATCSMPAIVLNDSETKCPVCFLQFKTEKEVSRHMSEVHSYVCTECAKTFYTLYEFTAHKCPKANRSKSNKTKKDENKEVSNILNFVKINFNNFKTTQSDKSCNISSNDAVLEGAQDNLPKVSQTDANKSKNNGSILKAALTKSPEVSDSISNSLQLCENSAKSSKDSNKINDYNKDHVHCYDQNELSVTLGRLLSKSSVTIDWIPPYWQDLKDNQFTCARCCVICDNKKDYFDHIQECLKITDVTIEKASNIDTPPRLLNIKAKKFSCPQENYNLCTVNPQLMNELNTILTKQNNTSTNTDGESFLDLLVDDSPFSKVPVLKSENDFDGFTDALYTSSNKEMVILQKSLQVSKSPSQNEKIESSDINISETIGNTGKTFHKLPLCTSLLLSPEDIKVEVEEHILYDDEIEN